MSNDDLFELRGMLELSFGPAYDDTAWQHCLGGTHFLLFYHGELISHVAVVPRHLTVGGVGHRGVYVESVATKPAFGGRRFGSILLSAASAHIIDEYEIGALSASRLAFYRRAGWQVWTGRTFVSVGGDERENSPVGKVLVLLPRSSKIDIGADLVTDWRNGDIW